MRQGNQACGSGTCTDVPEEGETAYSCQCAEGYFLRKNENRCVQGACMAFGNELCGEGAKCTDLPEKGEDGYTCQCPEDEAVLDDTSKPGRPFCNRDPCLLHDGKAAKACAPGSCAPDVKTGTYSCSCPKHLMNDKDNPDGDRCVEPPDNCYGLCRGESTCEGEVVGESTCVCPVGKSVQTDSETHVSTCLDDPCAGVDCGGGRCVLFPSTKSGYRCLCSPGYMKVFAGGKENCRRARY